MESTPSGSPQVVHIPQQDLMSCGGSFEAQHEVASPVPKVGELIPYGRLNTHQAQLIIMPYPGALSINQDAVYACVLLVVPAATLQFSRGLQRAALQAHRSLATTRVSCRPDIRAVRPRRVILRPKTPGFLPLQERAAQ